MVKNDQELFEVEYSKKRKIYPSTFKKFADGTYYNLTIREAYYWFQKGKAHSEQIKEAHHAKS